MAAQTLKEQVAGLTKNTPTSDDLLTSFFNDGYKDIVNRLGMINKKDLHKFAINDITYTTATSGSLIAGEQYKIITFVTGDDFKVSSVSPTIISGTINTTGCVFIATGTTPDVWTNGSTLIRRFNTEDVIEILSVARGDYPSVGIDAETRGELVIGSLFLPTSHYPKHYMLDSYLIIVPEPTSTAKGTISKIILPTITVSGTSIDYFPTKYLHLIVLYASVETLQYRAINYTLPSSLVMPVAPAAITISEITGSLPSNISAPIINSGEITLPTGSIPTFTSPVSESNMSDFDTAYDADDIELAAIDIQKQGQLLQGYQLDIQNAMQQFNKENVQYQAEVNKAMQEVAQKISSDVQQFTAELQKYAGEVNKYSAEVQSVSAANNSSLANYQAELGAYSAELQTYVQKFTTDIQSVQLEYTWILNQARLLAAEYEKGFVPFQQPQQSEGAK